MITRNRYDISDGITYQGLSTDTKPTEDVAPNSIFVEIDTSTVYYFDADKGSWEVFGG